jgi:hypothetical protein
MEVGANFGFASVARIALSGESIRGTSGFTYVHTDPQGLKQSKYHLYEDAEINWIPTAFVDQLKDAVADAPDACFFVERVENNLNVFRCTRDDAATIVQQFFDSVTVSEVERP